MKIGMIIGSLSSQSINRRLALALQRLAPEDCEILEIPISSLPLYNYDLDDNFPAVAREFKSAIEQCDGLLYVTPEYNRSIPGALKNAIDWASRPAGQGVLGRPSGVIGTSPGMIGTALAQQHLKGILLFFNAPVMGQPEGYIQFTPEMIDAEGNIENAGTENFLRGWVTSFCGFVARQSR